MLQEVTPDHMKCPCMVSGLRGYSFGLHHPEHRRAVLVSCVLPIHSYVLIAYCMSSMHAAVVCLTLVHSTHMSLNSLVNESGVTAVNNNRHISVKALQHVSAICILQPAKHANRMAMCCCM